MDDTVCSSIEAWHMYYLANFFVFCSSAHNTIARTVYKRNETTNERHRFFCSSNYVSGINARCHWYPNKGHK